VNFDFAAYLDAKYPLDSRSLNRDVLENLRQAIAAKPHLRCLDFGTGTGAMAKRLVEMDLSASLEIIGLDTDAGLLDIAEERMARRLTELGFETSYSGHGIFARRKTRTVHCHFERASALDWNPDRDGGNFDLITAHAFMDLVPLEPLVEKGLNLLIPAGIFYTTLNYDGETALIPVYADEPIERKILDHYDLSMEIRRNDGMATGGAHSGRRLAGAFTAAGFELLSYGSSDWNITPVSGVYRDHDAWCLRALLSMIHGEASASRRFDSDSLEDWYSDRLRAADARSLGMIVHQLDILALRPARPRV
jgi:SAM-dependent methyltransferase